MIQLSQISTNNHTARTEIELKPIDERALVEQAKTDPIAFGKLFRMHYDCVYKYLLHRTANPHLAHDLCSTTFFKAMKSLGRFKWQGVPLSAWLLRIALNEANKHYRKHRNNHPVSIDDFAENIAEPSLAADRSLLEAEKQLAQNKLFLEVHREIRTLQPKYQDVIVLKYFEKKKIREIAEILKKPVGTIKSLLHRAQKQLKGRLEGIYSQTRSYGESGEDTEREF
ncbi:MAG: RNA polymerase sigma factor [bacterium]